MAGRGPKPLHPILSFLVFFRYHAHQQLPTFTRQSDMADKTGLSTLLESQGKLDGVIAAHAHMIGYHRVRKHEVQRSQRELFSSRFPEVTLVAPRLYIFRQQAASLAQSVSTKGGDIFLFKMLHDY
jgi:hypothetical protein